MKKGKIKNKYLQINNYKIYNKSEYIKCFK